MDTEHGHITQEMINEANEIAAIREKSEKAGCVAARHAYLYRCECRKCWHDEFDNCICGSCTKHE